MNQLKAKNFKNEKVLLGLLFTFKIEINHAKIPKARY